MAVPGMMDLVSQSLMPRCPLQPPALSSGAPEHGHSRLAADHPKASSDHITPWLSTPLPSLWAHPKPRLPEAIPSAHTPPWSKHPQSISHVSTHFSRVKPSQPYGEVTVPLLPFSRERSRHREVKQLSPGHIDSSGRILTQVLWLVGSAPGHFSHFRSHELLCCLVTGSLWKAMDTVICATKQGSEAEAHRAAIDPVFKCVRRAI